jgi:hypothetical protein
MIMTKIFFLRVIFLVPILCPVGSYSSPNRTSCVSCPAGYFCSEAGGSISLCQNGSYSLENWAYCVVCPPGYSCTNTASPPTMCTPGTYSLGGRTFCETCPIGSYASKSGSVTCNRCPAGHSCLTPTEEPLVSLKIIDSFIFDLYGRFV